MVKGIIVEKKKLIKDGFDFSVIAYKANAHFADGSVLRGVSVLENFCYSMSSKGEVFIFKIEEQDKGFRLERIYEN